MKTDPFNNTQSFIILSGVDDRINSRAQSLEGAHWINSILNKVIILWFKIY